ncbi:hypothetical protein QQF64_027697 [Cirrhinus molitorella]|uniref:Uncharacterized protein n=1 Tax=Cirrhinus molitorella TaxID=172907 RepID=A0ABR3NDT5_9TELE
MDCVPEMPPCGKGRKRTCSESLKVLTEHESFPGQHLETPYPAFVTRCCPWLPSSSASSGIRACRTGAGTTARNLQPRAV